MIDLEDNVVRFEVLKSAFDTMITEDHAVVVNYKPDWYIVHKTKTGTQIFVFPDDAEDDRAIIQFKEEHEFPVLFDTYEVKSTIMAMSFFPILQLTEGIIVHYENMGFMVHKSPKEDCNNEIHVIIIQDDDYLKYEHGQMMWVHDGPVGNA